MPSFLDLEYALNRLATGNQVEGPFKNYASALKQKLDLKTASERAEKLASLINDLNPKKKI